MTLPNRYGYQPRSQWEADDLDAEARHWDEYAKKPSGRGNCLFVALLWLALAGALVAGIGTAQAHNAMPGLYLETYLPSVNK